MNDRADAAVAAVKTDPDRESPSAVLARFAATLDHDAIPAAVMRRAEDLYLDWLGSALAGKGARSVEAIGRFALQMGTGDGPSEVLISRRRTSALFAVLVRGAPWH